MRNKPLVIVKRSIAMLHDGSYVNVGGKGSLAEAKKQCQNFATECKTEFPSFRIDTNKGFYCGYLPEWENVVIWLGWGYYKVMTVAEFYHMSENIGIEQTLDYSKKSYIYGGHIADHELIRNLRESMTRLKKNRVEVEKGYYVVDSSEGVVAYGLRTVAQAKRVAEKARHGLKLSELEIRLSIVQGGTVILRSESNSTKSSKKIVWLAPEQS